MKRPHATTGLRHVALLVKNFSECEHFYTNIIGLHVDWRPDEDNVYLTSGNDDLALHRAPNDFNPGKDQRLDHIGFFLHTKNEVDEWHEFLKASGVHIKQAPKDHRDGTRSVYCLDPDGNTVQMIYVPHLPHGHGH